MGRRRRIHPEIPEALQGNQTYAAERKIDALERAQIEVMVPRPFELANVLAMCFDRDVLDKATAFFPYQTKHYHNVSYVGASLTNGQIVNLGIDWEETGMCAIAPTAFNAQNDSALCAWVDGAKAIVKKWEQVRRVFKFLNQNATVGAMRHYWPSVLALIPNDGTQTPIHQTDGVRFKDVPNIGLWLGAIRESAATVTSALMIPESAYKHRGTTMNVAFKYADEMIETPTRLLYPEHQMRST